MKAFMKLLVTVIVIGVIGFIVGYLLMNGAKKNVDEVKSFSSGEEIITLEKSGEKFGEIVPTVSGDVDNNDSESGENIPKVSKEEKIKMIDEQVKKIASGDSEVESTSEKLTLDMVNESAESFMKYFKVNELSATVKRKKGCIEIIPDTDFIENMVYYYDENGNLILYESVSTTVGGSCKYYFDKGVGVSVIEAYEEKVETKQEYIGDVLNRAKLIYDKYAN